MVKARKKTGFTLAEMMIVVGILAILMAVAFIGIMGYLRSMEKLEFDGYAREIFISAQNHLAVAENQGYYGLTSDAQFGTAEKNDANEKTGVYYFVVPSNDPDESTLLLAQMLPFGSIDETIRKGNSGYLIRYHKDSAQILDVFYWATSGSRYSHTYVEGDHDEFLKDTSRGTLRNYGNSVIGYYGGEDASGLEKGAEVKAPEIQVFNEDKLYVKVFDKNENSVRNTGGYYLKLIVTGKTSGAKKEVELYSSTNITGGGVSSADGTSKFIQVKPSGSGNMSYVVVLDDITEESMHFADFASDGIAAGNMLIPGEDISIQAVASNNSVLTNVAYSTEQTTNSLYGIGTDTNAPLASKAVISSIRHLENLDPDVSKVNAIGASVMFTSAEQATDISWTAFQANVFDAINQKIMKKSAADASESGNATGIGVYCSSDKKVGGNIVKTIEGSGATAEGYFCPITINTSNMNFTGTSWDYNGQKHVISDVKVYLPIGSAFTGAGLFADLTGESGAGSKYAVHDLQLVDFSVKSEKSDANAGALAGQISNAVVTNVVAYHTTGVGVNADVLSVSGTKHTGGLVGYVNDSMIYKSGAALKVSTTGDNGGGFAGFVNGTSDILSCFAGGHTIGGEYKPDHDSVTNDFNVKASTNAGGLIGKADDTTKIRYSYSTCSVMATGTNGSTAVGGLVGVADDAASSVKYCYSTGLVKAAEKAPTGTGESPKVGAFIGDAHASLTVSNSYYYQIINKITAADGTISYLPQFGSSFTDADIAVAAIDATATTYDTFVGNSWRTAHSYDGKLQVFYQGKYNLKTTKQMVELDTGINTNDKDLAEAKEADPSTPSSIGDFVLHHYGDWPAPETWVFNTKS